MDLTILIKLIDKKQSNNIYKMKSLRAWFASPAGKRFFNIFYSLGAAIVVLGAMCKIIHFPGANAIFITGMLIEVLVFALSAFDTSSYDNTPVTVARGITINDSDEAVQASNQSSGNQSTSVASGQSGSGGGVVSGGTGSGGSSVIVVGGSGGSTAGSSASAVPNTGSVSSGIGGTTSGTVVVGGGTVGSSSGTGSATVGTGVAGGGYSGSANIQQPIITSDENLGASAKEYSQNVSDAAQNLEEFSNTMQSLNEASQKILDTYKQIAETNNMAETMNTVRYINDSLLRIKNLYDGAIGDSYMFKEEMSKMTRHIEALNNVYARLLQAMTANNNPNIPPTTY